MTSAPSPKLDLVAVSADLARAIDHSRWGNRLLYLSILTGFLVVVMSVAIFLDKSTHVISTLAWMVMGLAFLTVVTPSGEQVIKMLAQVGAIRAGTKGVAS